jgi:uncharacterized membrane protein
MMKKWSKHILLPVLIALLPMLFGVAIYHRLPPQLPTHWNFSGAVDGYSSKAFTVFGLPLIMAGTTLLVPVFISLDPKSANMSTALKKLVVWSCPVLSLVLTTSILLIGLGYNLPIPLIVCILVGILFMMIGNYLPKTKQSYTMGIRLPWTLHSEENWNRTHRLAGKLWMIGGLLMIVCGVLTQYTQSGLFATFIFVGIMGLVFIPTLYSLWLYKKGI